MVKAHSDMSAQPDNDGEHHDMPASPSASANKTAEGTQLTEPVEPPVELAHDKKESEIETIAVKNGKNEEAEKEKLITPDIEIVTSPPQEFPSSALNDVPEENESRSESRIDDQELVINQYLASQLQQQQQNQLAGPGGVPSEIDIRELQVLPPEGGWGWLVVFGSFLSMIVVDGICFSFGIFLTDLEEHFQATKLKITWCNSLLTGMYLIAGPGASALVNRFGYRLVVMAGAVGAAAAFVTASFLDNVDAFIIVFGVFGGLCFGLIYLPGVTIVGYWFSARRATATGIAVCGSGVGMIIFGFLSPPLIEEYSWRGSLVIFAGVILHCMISGAFFMPLDNYHRMKADADAKRRQKELIRKAAEATGQPADSPKASLIKGKKFSRLNAAAEDECNDNNTHHVDKRKKKKKKAPPKKPKLAIHRNSIMQKIIEEKQRQRNTSVGSLDGMIITRENQLIEPPPDYNDRPSFSVNAIHRIVDSVLRKQADRRSTTGSALGLSSSQLGGSGVAGSGSRSRQNSSRGAAAAALKNSMPQLVSCYISQQSLAHQRTNPAGASNQTGLPFASRISLDPWIDQMNQEGLTFGPEERDEIVTELRREVAKPMNRIDLYYSGSIAQLPHYISHPTMEEYICSVTNLPEEANQTKADMQRLFDVSILKDKTFLLLSLSSIFSMLGFLIPYAFVADYATHMGITKSTAAKIISIIGFANTIGRILSGIISDRPWADALWINNVTLMVAGIATMLLPFLKVFELLAVYGVVFGLCIAAFASLRSIIIVDLLGLGRLTNAFGFLLLFQGVAIMVGPPFAGSFYDRYQSFDMTFYLGGAFMLFSGILCIPVRRLSEYEKKQRERRERRAGGSSDTSQVDTQCVSAV